VFCKNFLAGWGLKTTTRSAMQGSPVAAGLTQPAASKEPRQRSAGVLINKKQAIVYLVFFGGLVFFEV
jgi:hypothetical protein